MGVQEEEDSFNLEKLEKFIIDEKESSVHYAVRLPQRTIRHFLIAVHFYGKTQQKTVEELFEAFYQKMIGNRAI